MSLSPEDALREAIHGMVLGAELRRMRNKDVGRGWWGFTVRCFATRMVCPPDIVVRCFENVRCSINSCRMLSVRNGPKATERASSTRCSSLRVAYATYSRGCCWALICVNPRKPTAVKPHRLAPNGIPRRRPAQSVVLRGQYQTDARVRCRPI
jgi:hypothetical protein